MISTGLMQLYAFFGLAVVLVAFLVIVKTLGGLGGILLRMEYLLSREYELVMEKEKIKQTILRRQQEEEDRKRKREEELDPLVKIPYSVKKKG
ncbi:MAG: hypothetical protein V1913_07820 [Fibrobacterota bacterium]